MLSNNYIILVYKCRALNLNAVFRNTDYKFKLLSTCTNQTEIHRKPVLVQAHESSRYRAMYLQSCTLMWTIIMLTDLRCLNGSVCCSGRNLESLCVELEVMDQGLHRTLWTRRRGGGREGERERESESEGERSD